MGFPRSRARNQARRYREESRETYRRRDATMSGLPTIRAASFLIMPGSPLTSRLRCSRAQCLNAHRKIDLPSFRRAQPEQCTRTDASCFPFRTPRACNASLAPNRSRRRSNSRTVTRETVDFASYLFLGTRLSTKVASPSPGCFTGDDSLARLRNCGMSTRVKSSVKDQGAQS
jgi:hypothetical protein